MASKRRNETAAAIAEARISAIIRANDQTLAADAMEAAIEGGFRVIEFTLTTPGALELIKRFSKRSDLLVGAGTVMSPEQAHQAVDAGAAFLVSPIVETAVIAEAAVLDVASIPGAYSPTEMETAHRCGADFVKVFPAPAGGVDFIRAVRGPLPHIRLFPTNGVTAENLGAYLDVGCAGAGFVAPLFDAAAMAAHDMGAIRQRAAAITAALAAWRASR